MLLDSSLQLVDGGRELVHGVGILLDQISHHAHALVEGVLHVGDLFLQHLDLRLDLDDFLANSPERGGGSQKHGYESETCNPSVHHHHE